MKNKKLLSDRLKHFKKVLSGVMFLGEDDAMKALDDFIKQAEDNERLVSEALMALSNPKNLEGVVKDVISSLEEIVGGK